MSLYYDEYLESHKTYVKSAFRFIVDNNILKYYVNNWGVIVKADVRDYDGLSSEMPHHQSADANPSENNVHTDILTDVTRIIQNHINMHDNSKYARSEYGAYDDYFYGDNVGFKEKEAFDKAWLNHIHSNSHHWQHWILIEDSGNIVPIEMPFTDVVEMVCDWWSFSWKNGNLYEIFDWYEANKDSMLLHGNTRHLVESMLFFIKDTLQKKEGDKDEESEG